MLEDVSSLPKKHRQVFVREAWPSAECKHPTEPSMGGEKVPTVDTGEQQRNASDLWRIPKQSRLPLGAQGREGSRLVKVRAILQEQGYVWESSQL